VPHTFLATEKSDQHWMVVNGQKVNFPGGGTHFPNGADKYIASLAKVWLDPAAYIDHTSEGYLVTAISVCPFLALVLERTQLPQTSRC